MIKYFHELTQDEFGKIVDSHMTWGECAKQYPQPVWCDYPDAVEGMMGCWSLMSHIIKKPSSCYGCDLFRPKTIKDWIYSRPIVIRNYIKDRQRIREYRKEEASRKDKARNGK